MPMTGHMWYSQLQCQCLQSLGSLSDTLVVVMMLYMICTYQLWMKRTPHSNVFEISGQSNHWSMQLCSFSEWFNYRFGTIPRAGQITYQTTDHLVLIDHTLSTTDSALATMLIGQLQGGGGGSESDILTGLRNCRLLQ